MAIICSALGGKNKAPPHIIGPGLDTRGVIRVQPVQQPPFHGVTSARRILSERTGGPMTDRRAFLHSLAAGAATLSLPTFNPRAIRRLTDAHVIAGARPAARLADDEVYWSEIQRAFDLDRTMINLNNGGCSPAPTHVLDQMIRDIKFSNELPVTHMWS